MSYKQILGFLWTQCALPMFTLSDDAIHELPHIGPPMCCAAMLMVSTPARYVYHPLETSEVDAKFDSSSSFVEDLPCRCWVFFILAPPGCSSNICECLGVSTRASLGCGSMRRFKTSTPSAVEGPQVPEEDKEAFRKTLGPRGGGQ
eukprot:scaffold36714_cov19-Tisochrysis_lutea.AAC.2